MSKIITITFSPCVDKNFSAPAFVHSRKIHCSAPAFNAGGGGINVARALHRLGENAIAIFPEGGATGHLLQTMLEKENVPTITVPAVNETRENIMIRDDSTALHYQFIMPPVDLYDAEFDAIVAAVGEQVDAADFIVISGSLPSRFPGDVFDRISRLAKKHGVRIVIDTSGPPLLRALEAGAWLVKPNLNELCKLVGESLSNKQEQSQAAQKLIQEYGCEAVVVSLGKEGAMLVTKDNITHYHAPLADTKSTAGAGDSMVAGIIHWLSVGNPLEDAVSFGVACGTSATLHEGTELCHPDDALKLYNDVMHYSLTQNA